MSACYFKLISIVLSSSILTRLYGKYLIDETTVVHRIELWRNCFHVWISECKVKNNWVMEFNVKKKGENIRYLLGKKYTVHLWFKTWLQNWAKRGWKIRKKKSTQNLFSIYNNNSSFVFWGNSNSSLNFWFFFYIYILCCF